MLVIVLKSTTPLLNTHSSQHTRGSQQKKSILLVGILTHQEADNTPGVKTDRQTITPDRHIRDVGCKKNYKLEALYPSENHSLSNEM